MPDENGNPTAEESVAAGRAMCDSMQPIVAWMQNVGIKRLANNGLELELEDVPTEVKHLRETVKKLQEMMIKYGMEMKGPESRYRIPDMPLPPVSVVEED